MRPITDVLVEFSRGASAMPPSALLGEGAASPAELEDTRDHERECAEARQAGFDDGLAEGERRAAERLMEQAAGHVAALAQARDEWAAEQGAALAETLRSGLAALEGSVAAALTEALSPLLEGAVRSRAVDEIRTAITDLLAGGQGGVIEVSGPTGLTGPVQAAFAGQAAVVVTETDGPEVSVRAADVVITTQIEAWTSRLRAAMEMPA